MYIVQKTHLCIWKVPKGILGEKSALLLPLCSTVISADHRVIVDGCTVVGTRMRLGVQMARQHREKTSLECNAFPEHARYMCYSSRAPSSRIFIKECSYHNTRACTFYLSVRVFLTTFAYSSTFCCISYNLKKLKVELN